MVIKKSPYFPIFGRVLTASSDVRDQSFLLPGRVEDIYIYIFFGGGGGCHTVFRGNGGEISHNQSIKGGGGCRKLIPIKGGVNKNITEPYGGEPNPTSPPLR